ncbi:MAG: energy transducer TonB [candidate division Zixibacteria bacterium]|nr:energy transducer TonB [candidate division Zixibacteria bacterium]
MTKTYWKIGFDLKSKYQKNLLLSICIVNGLLLIPVMIFVLFLSENSIDKLDINFDTLSNKNEGDSSSSGKNAQGSNDLSYSMLLPSDFPKGYIGKVKIIREYKKPEINVSNSVTANSTNYNIPICDVSNDEISFGDGSGNFYGYGDDDFGLPGQKSLLGIAWEKYPKGLGQRKIEIPKPDEPAFIRLTEMPRHPADAYKITGKVVVEFIITRKGTILNRKVLSETPLDLGFAKAVLGALNEAWYWPAKNKGEAINTKVTLTWEMCWNCELEITCSDERLIVNK